MSPSPLIPTHAFARRSLLGGAALGVGALALSSCTDDAPGSAGAAGQPSGAGPTIPLAASDATLGAGGTGFSLFADESLNFEALFALGGAGLNAEVGEVIAAVDQANAAAGGATIQSYYDAMIATANRLNTAAGDALAAGHTVTARDRFMRAAQYYNQALFFVLGTSTPAAEPKVFTAMDEAWTRSMQLLGGGVERIEIPYEDTTLPGWFFAPTEFPDGAGGPRPTVILNNGSDGQNVDLWAWGTAAGRARGFNVVMFDGPGQGSMLFLRDQVFRPDWEHVITPVIDHLVERDDVDPGRLALIGWSEGGELVARAAAFDHRLAALVTDPGSVDVYLAFPEFLRQVADAGDAEQVNQEWAETVVPGSTPAEKFELMKRLEIYSVDALHEARRGEIAPDWYGLSRRIQEFQVREVAAEIRCPTLVVNYELEQFYPGQATELERLLTAPHDRVDFTVEQGAQYHCAPMAPQFRNEVLYDWISQQFER